jgi:Rod binding domain-containing protein
MESIASNVPVNLAGSLSTGSTGAGPLGASQAGAPKTPEQIRQVATEFEGVFLSMLVKEMRDSLETGFFGDESSDSYGGMFDLFIGKHLADAQPLGVGDMILKSYQEKFSAETTESAPEPKSISITA